ncbi:MAG: hypothetical protein Q7T82_11385 [Armatimonadota bacterium]|nr:hypothetical protein [Armatimonadota bacterium]
MANTPTTAQLTAMRTTLAEKKAELSAYETQLHEAECERLEMLHLELGLPDIHTLIAELRKVARVEKKPSGLSAEMKAKVRADLAAKVPLSEIREKHNISSRVLGGIKGTAAKSTATRDVAEASATSPV